MHSNEHNAEAIVIGGGMAGLAAAAFLARYGKKVRLFEQSHALGGRAQTRQQEGFYLNIGPHALYRGGRGIEVLGELGVHPRGRVPSVSGGFAIKDGVKHTFPAGAISLFTTGLFGLSAKLETARFLRSIGNLDGSGLMEVSVSEWLDQKFSHNEVKEFVLAAFRVATYTNAPDLMSAGAAIEQLKEAFTKGVLYVDGGWQTLVDELREVAVEAGVTIETGSRVDAVTRDAADGVSGVRLAEGRQVDAQIVVIASSPSTALRLVERGDRTSMAKWENWAIPVRAACLDVALNRLPIPKATFALGVDRPLYLSVHSATARLAPEGCALIQTAKYLAPGDCDSAEEIERELEGTLDLVQPGWREVIVYRRFLPDMVVMNAMPLASVEGMQGRPKPRVDDVRGLFVAGDWVGNEGLLVDAALASARSAAQAIAASSVPVVAAAV